MRILQNGEIGFILRHILMQTTICISVGCIDVTNGCSASVSIDKQLPEGGLVRPKHIEIKCEFNEMLK
jgi:hypothetical protein